MGMTHEELIDGLYDIKNWHCNGDERLHTLVTEAIKALEQEPRKGHWIDCDNSEDYSADGYDCSVCGVNAEYATSYCPNCGAKMEVEDGKNEH